MESLLCLLGYRGGVDVLGEVLNYVHPKDLLTSSDSFTISVSGMVVLNAQLKSMNSVH